jgi:hypothetical protein
MTILTKDIIFNYFIHNINKCDITNIFLFIIISKVNLSPALSIICMVIITKVMKSIVVVSVILEFVLIGRDQNH